MKGNKINEDLKRPPFLVSLIPIVLLLIAIVSVIISRGADAALSVTQYILFGAAVLTALIARLGYKCSYKQLWQGLKKSATQTVPAVPVLISIATVSATWMMSGVVPSLICYGLEILNPKLFLFLTCAICSVISVLSGTSWTTIATLGVAFMGIGMALGYDVGWIAGAIISGSYFGDKVSPLSDTTVLASTSCGVEMFAHIRYLMVTTIPSMGIALLVYLLVGMAIPTTEFSHSEEMVAYLHKSFNISAWTMIIPAVTCILIIFRIKTLVTLTISTTMGLIGMFVWQPQIANAIDVNVLLSAIKVLFTETSIDTGNETLNTLVATGGIEGMLPTIYLVVCAMIFGGMMLGSGMISSITHAFTRKLHSVKSIVGATVGCGLFFNSCTGDQYLSIILGGNVFKNLYKNNGLEPRLLSRSLEDSISVTSVLIPWNSCGVTQSTVLGVATLVYLPYCVFNYVSPLMTLIAAVVIDRRRKKNKNCSPISEEQ